MKSVGKRLGVGAMAVLAAAIVFLGCAARPRDDAPLTEIKFDGLMGTRYAEILLVFGNAVTKSFTAGVYNTSPTQRKP